MLTPQEVSSRAFPKAALGGYNMGAVDEFLDELTDDYTALYKENAALKAKMKVLVEKVEEYRATEDSMRATLLTAQRMADKIVQEAETKRDEMLAHAEEAAREKLQEYREQVYTAEERMKMVSINHGDGYSSIYMHMTNYVVSKGQAVSAGQVIGYVGSTGVSSGPHLHFGISYNGTYVNPANYVNLY